MPDYHPAGEQVFVGDLTGDCRRLECGEYGSIVQVLSGQDTPADDIYPCTKEMCKGWTPVHELLDEGTFCGVPGGGVGVCRGDGACVQCTSATVPMVPRSTRSPSASSARMTRTATAATAESFTNAVAAITESRMGTREAWTAAVAVQRALEILA